MTLFNIFLIFLGPWLVVGGLTAVALPDLVVEAIRSVFRPVARPPHRQVTRPRPARWVVA